MSMKTLSFIVTFCCVLVLVSTECLHPSTTKPTSIYAKATLISTMKTEKDGMVKLVPHVYRFFNVSIFVLSKDPLKQYALLHQDGNFRFVELKRQGAKSNSWDTPSGTINFYDLLTFVDDMDFTKTTMAQDRALDDMKQQCDLTILQDNYEVYVLRSMAVIIAILFFYTLYAILNFLVNYRTLREIRGNKLVLSSLFYSLSQAMVTRYLAQHHQLENEKIYIDFYKQMAEIGEKIKVLEVSTKVHMLLLNYKKSKDYTYDYVSQELGKSLINLDNNNLLTDQLELNNIKNDINSGYLTPVPNSEMFML